MNKSLRLTESAVMVAIAFVLSMLTVLRMPFGGSVSAFSMLPVAIIAYRYRWKWGLLVGITFGVLQLVLGLRHLQWATSAAAVVAIILLDYLIAYALVGLSGLFRGKTKDHGTGLAFGSLLACVLRYICHVAVGATVWAGLSIPNSDALIYSLAYNAAYMVPETLLMVVGAFYAGKVFTITEPQIKRVPLEKGALNGIYSAIIFSFGTVIAFIRIFALMQTNEGFDITNVANANIYDWITIAAIFAVGVAGSLIVKASLKPSARSAE
jgi:thiamine transporter